MKAFVLTRTWVNDDGWQISSPSIMEVYVGEHELADKLWKLALDKELKDPQHRWSVVEVPLGDASGLA